MDRAAEIWSENVKRPFWEGERVYLRPFEDSDVTDEYISWLNDPDVTAYLGERTKWGSTKSSVRKYLDRFKDTDQRFIFAIIHKESGGHIGNITLNDINWLSRRGEMGTMIGRKEFWRNGYGTEAKSLIIDLAFKRMGLLKIISSHVADNLASIKGNQRLGFQIEGSLRRHELINGELKDVTQMGLLQDEFKPYQRNENR